MQSRPPGPESPLILVADDVPANVELLQDQLHTLGYRIVAAYDGPSALATCVDRRPDLCILDVAMPAGPLAVDDRSTGFEVCRRIKRDPRTERIPVIFVTALSDTTDRVKAIEAGGDDFLTKPHNRLVLGARVRSLLRLKAATDALEESYRKLREAEQARDDLMHMIVHDLKTPLTAILATLELMMDGSFGPLAEPQRTALGDTDRQAQELLRLIEDILEIARTDQVRDALELEATAPRALLESILREWSMRLQQEGARIGLETAPSLPTLYLDPALLRRVFGNLIQNALVHASRRVTLRLGARPDVGGVRFTVADDGPGIPLQHQELIFQKFHQVRTEGAPRRRGSGIGLAFCRTAVEAHGGRIWVESTEGQGSTFHIHLPIHPPAALPSPE